MQDSDAERLIRGVQEWADGWWVAHRDKRLGEPVGDGVVLQIADGASLSPVRLAEQLRLRTPIGERFLRMVDRVIHAEIPPLAPGETGAKIEPLTTDEILVGLAREGDADRGDR